MRWILIIGLMVVTIAESYSQSVKSQIKLGKKAYKNQKYKTAFYYLSKAIHVEQNATIAWMLAESARKIKEYEVAEKWYQFVAENNLKQYPLAHFWLGYVQKHLAKYQKAQINFRKYVQRNASNKDYFTEKARHEVLSCEYALFLTFEKNSTPINLLDTSVNSPYSEFQATFNDSILWVTSYKPMGNEDSSHFTSKLIRFSYQNNKWKQLPLDTLLNNPNWLVSSFCFSKNKNYLVVSLCEYNGKMYSCKLYKSKKQLNKWSKPQLMSKLINAENATTTHPYLVETDSCNYLLFSSDREGSIGNLDLWAVRVNESLEPLEPPFNLGKNINSIDPECCPFYDLKKKTLYFSSEWNTNLGGMDIFSSYGWIKSLYPPQNLGYPINTNHDETFFQLSEDRTKAIFASNRSTHQINPNEKCCNDLYTLEFEKPEKDSAKIRELIQKTKHKLEELIPVTLYFHNDEPNPRTWDTTTIFSYDELYNRYIQLRQEYIKMYATPYKGEEKLQAEARIDAFFTEEVEKNYLKLLNFFQLMKRLLEKGETIAITVKGYASPLNNHAYNLNLSKRRVQSLINLLYRFEDGVFKPYINQTAENGGKLIIVCEAYGENMVAQGVSDDLNNLQQSVYSPEASKERKIAIIAIKMNKNK